MYRMTENQSRSRTVLNCARSCFHHYANHLPNHLLSIELKYPDFSYHFWICFISFLYYFVQTEFFHANLRFQKDFAGDKNVDFEFSDACLFGHPSYFGSQDFISFRLFISTF